jgi:hypothetical protein
MMPNIQPLGAVLDQDGDRSRQAIDSQVVPALVRVINGIF